MKVVSATVAAGCVLLFAAQLNGNAPQTPPPPLPLPSDGSPTAVIAYPGGGSLSILSNNSQFPLVVAYPDQQVTVVCRVPADAASFFVVQDLDGGTLTAPSPIALDGTTIFQFQAGTQPGLYRILVIHGDRSATLQFWVPIPNGDNPPLLTP